jgi:hypothetical protein
MRAWLFHILNGLQGCSIHGLILSSGNRDHWTEKAAALHELIHDAAAAFFHVVCEMRHPAAGCCCRCGSYSAVSVLSGA